MTNAIWLIRYLENSECLTRYNFKKQFSLLNYKALRKWLRKWWKESLFIYLIQQTFFFIRLVEIAQVKFSDEELANQFSALGIPQSAKQTKYPRI